MITRSEYMARSHVEGRSIHRAYYAQFVNQRVIKAVVDRIGRERLLSSVDEHFNDISLHQWYMIKAVLHCTFKSVGDYCTKAGLVCVYKEAARQYVESVNRRIKNEP